MRSPEVGDMDDVTEIREALEAHPCLAGRQIEVWKEVASGYICVTVSSDGQEHGSRLFDGGCGLITPAAIASMFAKAIAAGAKATTSPGA
jgi:hypothetical protein